jgi:hypothetical protein
MIGRLSQPQVSDCDPIVALAIDCAHLAVKDYLAGPGAGRGDGAMQRQRDFASAEDFLRRTGLLAKVHARLGVPEEADVAQLSLF